jgi:hypothetical protein
VTRGVRFSGMYVIGLRDSSEQNQQNTEQGQSSGAGRNTRVMLIWQNEFPHVVKVIVPLAETSSAFPPDMTRRMI